MARDSKHALNRIIVSRMGNAATLVIAGASIVDGLIGIVSVGFLLGGLRHSASLWAARRVYKQSTPDV